MSNNLNMEINFTETYIKYKNYDKALREAECLRVQFPSVLKDINDQDLFVGRIEYGSVGLSPQFGGFGYFCDEDKLIEAIEKGDLSSQEREKVLDILHFWKSETTTKKIEAQYSSKLNYAMPTDKFLKETGIAFPLYRMAGVYVDYDKLLRIGICGIKDEIINKLDESMENDEANNLYKGMLIGLDLFGAVCEYYKNQLLKKADETQIVSRKNYLLDLASGLDVIKYNKPNTFKEALQLAWLYSIMCGSLEFGRMDEYLGDFYVQDIENGVISEEEAINMLESIWRLINDLIVEVDGRVIIGGVGRRNEKNADRFALVALEATRRVKDILPQLTLRFYEGMNPEIMEKALNIIGEGNTFPLLYNDDVNVKSVENAFCVSREEAEQYVPFGCGEYVLNHRSYGTPSGAINLLKALEVTLHNGIDPISKKFMGIRTGKFKEFNSFSQLFDAYKKQVSYFIEILAEQESIEYEIVGKEASFLFMSMLYDDCIERGKSIFAGGIRYLGGTLETYGNVNTADSLTAIKELVYDRKAISPEKLIQMLDVNFKGYEEERNKLADCPKFGNDIDAADNMLIELHEYVCKTIRSQKDHTSLHSYLAVVINNGMNTTLGRWVKASADGRKAGGAMANANTPAGGNDKSGLTAMLNSIVKPTSIIHAGAVHNIRFSKELFEKSREKVKTLLKVYFNNGGSQAMLTVVDRLDMENAMREPEKYKNLFVRVGGFSARFVDLPKDVQKEVFERTTY